MCNLTCDKDRIQFGSDGMTYKQMSLFDDGSFQRVIPMQEKLMTAVGQL